MSPIKISISEMPRFFADSITVSILICEPLLAESWSDSKSVCISFCQNSRADIALGVHNLSRCHVSWKIYRRGRIRPYKTGNNYTIETWNSLYSFVDYVTLLRARQQKLQRIHQ